MFSDHNRMKLETNFKDKTQEHSYTWRLNNKLLDNGSTMRSRKKSKYLEMNENKQPENYGT